MFLLFVSISIEEEDWAYNNKGKRERKQFPLAFLLQWFRMIHYWFFSWEPNQGSKWADLPKVKLRGIEIRIARSTGCCCLFSSLLSNHKKKYIFYLFMVIYVSHVSSFQIEIEIDILFEWFFIKNETMLLTIVVFEFILLKTNQPSNDSTRRLSARRRRGKPFAFLQRRTSVAGSSWGGGSMIMIMMIGGLFARGLFSSFTLLPVAVVVVSLKHERVNVAK